MTPATAKEPPYLSVVEGEDGPQLVLTVEADALLVCERCPHLHVRVLDTVATTDAIRHFATSLRQWADRLEGVQ